MSAEKLIKVTKNTSFAVTLNREELESALLQWLDSKQPKAKKRTSADFTFNTDDEGNVTGVMFDVTVPE